MIGALPKKYGKNIFNPNPHTIRQSFETLRKQLVDANKDERFMQIHIHTLRHYFASNMYRKVKVLKIVQDALGHKSITNTEIYTKTVSYTHLTLPTILLV